MKTVRTFDRNAHVSRILREQRTFKKNLWNRSLLLLTCDSLRVSWKASMMHFRFKCIHERLEILYFEQWANSRTNNGGNYTETSLRRTNSVNFIWWACSKEHYEDLFDQNLHRSRVAFKNLNLNVELKTW